MSRAINMVSMMSGYRHHLEWNPRASGHARLTRTARAWKNLAESADASAVGGGTSLKGDCPDPLPRCVCSAAGSTTTLACDLLAIRQPGIRNVIPCYRSAMTGARAGEADAPDCARGVASPCSPVGYASSCSSSFPATRRSFWYGSWLRRTRGCTRFRAEGGHSPGRCSGHLVAAGTYAEQFPGGRPGARRAGHGAALFAASLGRRSRSRAATAVYSSTAHKRCDPGAAAARSCHPAAPQFAAPPAGATSGWCAGERHWPFRS